MDYSKLAWISFFGPRRPINGQKIYYYGKHIGVWQGRYEIHHDDPVSAHIIICEERSEETDEVLSEYGLKGITMMVDRMDAPWWMPYEGQAKPAKPDQDYPPEYPK
jgi:hypothetical protein